MLSSGWFLEISSPDEINMYSIEGIRYSSVSQYQKVEIMDLKSFGKTLVLDGKVQSAESDEFIYHEALTHPALISIVDPKKVLIAGGGEGALIREILKYPTIEKVYMVDLDREVVEICREHLFQWHQGTMDDPRVTLVYEDARRFIAESDDLFDAIILDLPEPAEAGPAIMLYTREFYQEVFNHLNAGGVMTTQATSVAIHNFSTYTIIHRTIQKVFPVVRPYWTSIPSFCTPWGFVFASKHKDPLSMTEEEIQSGLKNLKGPLKFYDAQTHQGLFALPRHLREALHQQDRVNRDDEPISFY